MSKAGQFSDGSGEAACAAGELPSAISREGLTWPDDMSAATRAALEKLQTQLETLEHDVNELADHVALSRRLP